MIDNAADHTGRLDLTCMKCDKRVSVAKHLLACYSISYHALALVVSAEAWHRRAQRPARLTLPGPSTAGSPAHSPRPESLVAARRPSISTARLARSSRSHGPQCTQACHALSSWNRRAQASVDRVTVLVTEWPGCAGPGIPGPGASGAGTGASP